MRSVPRVWMIALTAMTLALGPFLVAANADCGTTSPNGCPFSGESIHTNGDGSTCTTVTYGGELPDGTICLGVCESGSCGDSLPMGGGDNIVFHPAGAGPSCSKGGAATPARHPAGQR